MAVKNNNVWTGADINYAEALVKEIGCELTIIEAPWARGLEMLKIGKVDFMVNMSKNPLREKYFHFIGPQRVEKIRLISKKNALPLINSWTQLKTLDAILMRQRGSYFGKKFEKILNKNKILKIKLREFANNDISVKLVFTVRVDALLVDELYLDALPKDVKNLLDVHPLIINSNSVYYAFSKVNFDKVQIEKVQKAFNTLSKTSKFAEFSKVQFN
jgi:polar amino acid transport system substrate-binding protein